MLTLVYFSCRTSAKTNKKETQVKKNGKGEENQIETDWSVPGCML